MKMTDVVYIELQKRNKNISSIKYMEEKNHMMARLPSSPEFCNQHLVESAL